MHEEVLASQARFHVFAVEVYKERWRRRRRRRQNKRENRCGLLRRKTSKKSKRNMKKLRSKNGLPLWFFSWNSSVTWRADSAFRF